MKLKTLKKKNFLEQMNYFAGQRDKGKITTTELHQFINGELSLEQIHKRWKG